MAHVDREFRKFNSEIRLSDSRREALRTSRNAICQTITSRFQTNGIPVMPEFKAQGSFVMDTIVEPIDCDFDLDLGVYFIGDLPQDKRPVPAVFHEAIMSAVEDQTNKVIDKDTCVRVKYVRKYHIDLPIYYRSYSHPELAHKKRGWVLSNPLEFIAWFESRTGSGFRTEFMLTASLRGEYEQWKEDIRKKDVLLRRLVRYAKAWADFQGKDQMPSGVCLTILIADNYVQDINDDLAFFRTMERVLNRLTPTFSCPRPTTPVGEDLFASYTADQRDYFMTRLSSLVQDGRRAIDANEHRRACDLWQHHFGPRFICEPPSEVAQATKSLSIVIGNEARPYAS